MQKMIEADLTTVSNEDKDNYNKIVVEGTKKYIAKYFRKELTRADASGIAACQCMLKSQRDASLILEILVSILILTWKITTFSNATP